MPDETIEARYLQEETRDLFHLLQRVHSLEPDFLLPVDEVSVFTGQVGRVFVSALPARCFFRGSADCHIEMPNEWFFDRDITT